MLGKQLESRSTRNSQYTSALYTMRVLETSTPCLKRDNCFDIGFSILYTTQLNVASVARQANKTQNATLPKIQRSKYARRENLTKY